MTNRELMAQALEAWEHVPYDCLKYKDSHPVVLSNGFERQVVTLPNPVTRGGVEAAEEHYRSLGVLVPIDDVRQTRPSTALRPNAAKQDAT